MLVQVNTDNHIAGREELVAEVTAELETALSRFEPQLTRVEVHLADENSHKTGSADKSCVLEARLSGLDPIAVTQVGGTVDQALDAALESLVTTLDRKLGKLGEKKGRPSFSGD
jgi:hypothetical protein